MASAFDTRASAIGSPLGLRFNGESVTREIASDSTDTESQTAIVVRESVTVERGLGLAFAFDYQMQLDSTSTVTDADTYLIDSARCNVVRVGEITNGLRPVWLQRVEDRRKEVTGSRFLR